MSKKRLYILVDTMNMAFRARHGGSKAADIDQQIGMSMHIMLTSIASCVHRFGQDTEARVVFNFEGKSWRKKVSAQYKANRDLKKLERTPREVEEDELFIEAVESFKEFVTEKTNAICLQHDELEADDFIAFWIQHHPDDDHIIVSTDSDYKQLIAENVDLFDGVRDYLYTIDGVFDNKGRPVEKKGVPLTVEPDYELFMKCIRGDKSDNIFSAYPGVREKGTKNKVGIREAFEDRHDKGYNYNNFMLQRWTNHEGEEVRVKDAYAMNRLLIDLTAQPEEYKVKGAITIENAKNAEPIPAASIGFNFMKFCQMWALNRIGEKTDFFAGLLSKGYQ